MRIAQCAIPCRPLRIASASAVVSAYTLRSSGSPKSGRDEPVKPPTTPFVPTMPTSPPSAPPEGKPPSMAEPDQDFGQLLETMKRSAGALREADVPFVLGGGLACWARGAPKTEHDVDFLVRPRDAERAQQALAAAGMRTEKPPEGWLLKAYDGDVLVDLIFHPQGGPVDDELFDRAEDP